MRTPSTRAALVLAFVVTACAGTAGEPTTGDPTMVANETAPAGSAPSLPVGEVPTELLEAVVADAAEKAGVAPAEVAVLAAEAVTWSDGSLGCPEPGMVYTQALVPGYRVVLEIGGDELHFHASQSGDFRFCEDPQPPLED